jgi:hypothetical protein
MLSYPNSPPVYQSVQLKIASHVNSAVNFTRSGRIKPGQRGDQARRAKEG